MTALLIVLAALVGAGAVIHSHERSGRAPAAPTGGSAPTTGSNSTTGGGGSQGHNGIGLNLHAHSTTEPRSIWVVINKKHPIRPLDFKPALTIVRGYQVAWPAAHPLEQLLTSADATGLGLQIGSAFRSYGYQVSVHDDLVESKGSAAADRISARPGYSEHQTGLAADLITPAHSQCDLEPCFAGTRAGRWLAANAWRYGFIVRYKPGEKAVTGYSPEPWHVRYVGRPLAAAMRRAGLGTLEQVFHIKGGGYPEG